MSFWNRIYSSAEKTANKNFRRKTRDFFDIKTFAIAFLLIIVGMLSIYSAGFESGYNSLFYRQLVSAGIGFAALIIVFILPEDWIKFNSITIYLLSIVLLIAVLIFGKTVSGTRGWFQISNLSFQPSEFAKIATLMLVARFLSQKGIDIRNLRDLLTVFVIFLVPIVLIVFQPDIGSATVLIVMFLAVLFWVGFDSLILYCIAFTPFALIISLLGIEYFIGTSVFFAITAAIFKKSLLKTLTLIVFVLAVGYYSESIYRIMPMNTQDRIDIYLHPEKDPLNKGYNVMQSVLAVGSGGFIGKGYLKGSQTQLRYIPEQKTDFIFCVPAEEFGFLGAVVVIVLYILLFMRTLSIASETNNMFFSILSFGIGTSLFYHALVNIGMVIRVIPVMGIPLPFMSYGGTALIMNMAMIGLLLKSYSLQKKKN